MQAILLAADALFLLQTPRARHKDAARVNGHGMKERSKLDVLRGMCVCIEEVATMVCHRQRGGFIVQKTSDVAAQASEDRLFRLHTLFFVCGAAQSLNWVTGLAGTSGQDVSSPEGTSWSCLFVCCSSCSCPYGSDDSGAESLPRKIPGMVCGCRDSDAQSRFLSWRALPAALTL